MSKTSQRKRGMYNQGWKDGRGARPFRWLRHEHYGHYRAGYRDGAAERDRVWAMLDLIQEQFSGREFERLCRKLPKLKTSGNQLLLGGRVVAEFGDEVCP